MANRTWRQISDEANAEPAITTFPNRDGSRHVDWQANEHLIVDTDMKVSVQAGGWRSPDGELVAGVMFAATIAANILSIDAARRTAMALMSAADDAERVRDDADLVPVFSDTESAR